MAVKKEYVRLTVQFVDRIMQKLGPTQTAVVIALLRHLNADLQCWPSEERIAELTGMSRVNVSRTITKLKDAGYISVELIKSETGVWHNRYTIVKPDILPFKKP